MYVVTNSQGIICSHSSLMTERCMIRNEHIISMPIHERSIEDEDKLSAYHIFIFNINWQEHNIEKWILRFKLAGFFMSTDRAQTRRTVKTWRRGALSAMRLFDFDPTYTTKRRILISTSMNFLRMDNEKI